MESLCISPICILVIIREEPKHYSETNNMTIYRMIQFKFNPNNNLIENP